MGSKWMGLLVLVLLLTISPAAFAQSGNVISDDFNNFRINADVWQVTDPQDNADIRLLGTNTPDAWLQIDVPGGRPQDVWYTGIQAPRVMQSVRNGDFEVETRFESSVDNGQSQGILVEQDQGNWLQVFFTRSGNSTVLIAAAASNYTLNLNTPNLSVTVGPAQFAPLWLRLNRTGNDWLVSYSLDGTTWTDTTPFSQRLAVAQVGLYAGVNSFIGNAPAFTLLADYFVNSDAPIASEDGAVIEDVFPPQILTTDPLPYENRVIFNWTTDEPSTARVEYGATTSFELGAVDVSQLTSSHSVELGGMSSGTTYSLRVTLTDALGNEDTIADLTTQTLDAPPAVPVIDLWYGDIQSFGSQGVPQRWINVLGRVVDRDPGDRVTMSYSLNDGPEMPLTVGPDLRRLQDQGDFNVEIAIDGLREGDNEILIRASDRYDNRSNISMNLRYSDQNYWAIPYSINWSDVNNLLSVVQPVDGHWSFDGSGVRTVEPGYRRMLAIGDISWREYEVTVGVTVHSLDPGDGAGTLADPEPYIGVSPRWTGYYNWGPEQPSVGPVPVGAVGRYVWRSALSQTATDGLDLLDSQLSPAAQDISQRPLALGIEYRIKMRVISGVDGSAFYSVKMWPADESEPDWWNIATSLPAGGTNAGSLALIANRVDATFEIIEVNNLTPDAYLLAGYLNTPPDCDLTVLGAGANLRTGAGPNFAVVRSIAGATVISVNGQRTGQDGFVWYRVAEDTSWIRSDLANIDATCAASLVSLDPPAAASN